MGVPGFYKYLRNNELFASCTGNTIKDKSNITHFCLDLNGIIHQAAQKIFQYGGNYTRTEYTEFRGEIFYSAEQLAIKYSEVYHEVINIVLELTTKIDPKEVLMIAVDGVAPQAKILQQRYRRYKSSAERDPYQVFDSNCISPGTDFMIGLDTYIKREIDLISDKNNMKYSNLRLPPTIVYSSHLVPGEGEHKIADYLRNVVFSNTTVGRVNKKTIVIHGMDADLIMIYSMMIKPENDSILNNIYLFRTHTKKYDIESVVNVRLLTEILYDLYPNAENPIDDFVLLLFFIGNDFLPKFQTFEVIDNTLTALIYGYCEFCKKYHNKNFKGLVTNNEINWENLSYFVDFIGKGYDEILFEEWARSDKIEHPSPLLPYSVKDGRYSYDIFKDKWYIFVFSPKKNPRSAVDKADVDSLIMSYLEGVSWVFKYYKEGIANVNQGWYYPFHYAPIFSDLADFMFENLPIRGPIWDNSWRGYVDSIPVLEQLLQILPPRSINILPDCLKLLYTDSSPIFDLFPETFLIDENGKLVKHEAVALVPIPNPLRISRALEYINIPVHVQNKYVARDTITVTREYRGIGPQEYDRGGRRGGYRGSNYNPEYSRGGYKGSNYNPDYARGGYRGSRDKSLSPKDRHQGTSRGDYRGDGRNYGYERRDEYKTERVRDYEYSKRDNYQSGSDRDDRGSYSRGRGGGSRIWG